MWSRCVAAFSTPRRAHRSIFGYILRAVSAWVPSLYYPLISVTLIRYIVVILFDISWLVLGSIWLSHYYAAAPIDEAKKIFIGRLRVCQEYIERVFVAYKYVYRHWQPSSFATGRWCVSHWLPSGAPSMLPADPGLKWRNISDQCVRLNRDSITSAAIAWIAIGGNGE